jgi:hypothetical protein
MSACMSPHRVSRQRKSSPSVAGPNLAHHCIASSFPACFARLHPSGHLADTPDLCLLPSSPWQELLPNAEYYKRQGFPLKKIVKWASGRDYTDLIVLNEDHKTVGGGGVGVGGGGGGGGGSTARGRSSHECKGLQAWSQVCRGCGHGREDPQHYRSTQLQGKALHPCMHEGAAHSTSKWVRCWCLPPSHLSGGRHAASAPARWPNRPLPPVFTGAGEGYPGR